MANSKRFVVKNGLETQNIQFVEVDGTETITLTVLEDGSLSFSGTSGQLFSITDSLTGSIFSVNDISGIPSIEVFDDGKVILAESTGNVGIGILTPTEKLHVAGNINISTGSTYKINGVNLSAANVGAEPANANIQSHISSTSNPHSVTATQVGLGNVTNESKATMFTNPTFTGTVSGVTKSMVGLGNVDNTSDANKPISTATQTALDGKANTVHTHSISDITNLSTQLGRSGTILIVNETVYANSGALPAPIQSSFGNGLYALVAHAGFTVRLWQATGNPPSLTWTDTGEEISKTKIYVSLNNNKSYRWTGYQGSVLTSFLQVLSDDASTLTGASLETTLSTGSDTKIPSSKAVATYVTGLGYVTSSGVTSVTGTSPVVSSGGATPAISLASGYGDTQNPYGTKTANTVLAGPTTGSASAPAFRSLVAADLPSHSHAIGDVTGLQTALDGKQATITGGATSITSSNLTASRALVSDGSGKVAVSAVTSTELGHVSGVTSAIQTQLNAKVNTSAVGAVNGVASLGSDGKVPFAQLPSSVTGGMRFSGTYSSQDVGQDFTLGYLASDNVAGWISNSSSDPTPFVGSYYINNDGGILLGSNIADSLGFKYVFYSLYNETNNDVEDFDNSMSAVLEPGDWIVFTEYVSATKTLYFSIVNNTYTHASTNTYGITRLSNSTSTATTGNNVITDGILSGLVGDTSTKLGRGDYAKAGYDHSVITNGTNPHNTTFANIASKPTTISGYGITDAVTTSGTQTIGGSKTFSGSISLTASGPTNALNLNNNNITGVNHITINDPGPNEGIEWVGGNTWKIYESPNDLTTNSGGNLQIVQNTTRRATFNTSGQLDIPVATGTAPFVVTSTTRVNNLNVATAGTADTLTTSRTISLGTAVTSTATSFNGSSNITIPVNTVRESFLSWGGQGLAGQVTPIGMSMSSEHNANRLAFINGDSLYFEYSSDAGSTWTDYGYNNSQKSQFCTLSLGVPIGRTSGEYTTDSRTRVTLTAQNGTTGYVYTNPRKMLIEISSSGGMQVLVETRTGANYLSDGAWSTFGTYTLVGWSGWNDIPLVLGTLGGGTTQTGNNWQLRLTFIMTSKNTTHPNTAQVNKLRIYGENTWNMPSTLAATNNLYSFDMSQNATFPANLNTNGTFGLRASTAGSSATQIPVFTADPSSTTRTLVTRTPSQLRADIGAGTGNGTVTSVGGTGTVAGLTLTGTVTTTGNLTLGGTLSTPVSTINDSTTVGQNLVKLTNPSAISFLRVNANNTVDALSASDFRTAIGAGTSSTTGTVTSVSAGNGMSFTTITGSGSVTLGTPSSLTDVTTNSVSGTTHTHAITNFALSGTANQITVTGAGKVLGASTTLSLPQNIHTAATPTFGGATLNGSVGLRASALATAATQILVTSADPSSTTRTVQTRTPAQLLSDIGGAADNAVVKLAGNQNITGEKTFTSRIITNDRVVFGALNDYDVPYIAWGGALDIYKLTIADYAYENPVSIDTQNAKITAATFASNVATGTAPFTVASTTAVTSLNADLLDGNHASAFYLASNPSGYTGNTGTVTSVGLSLPSFITVTNSPVTTSGTLTGTLASQTQKTFFAAPNAADGAPTFRTILASDVPTLNQNTTGTSAGVVRTVAGTTSAELVRGNMADNDQFRILVGGTASNAGFAEIATADDGTEPIHVRQYTGVFTTLVRTATLLDGSGNTSFPGALTVGGNLNITGNVTLQDKIVSIGNNQNNSSAVGFTSDTVTDITSAIASYVGNGTTTVTLTLGSSNSGYFPGLVEISGAVGTEQAKLNGKWRITSAPGTPGTQLTFVINQTLASGTYTTGIGTTNSIRQVFFGVDNNGSFSSIGNADIDGDNISGTRGAIHTTSIVNYGSLLGLSLYNTAGEISIYNDSENPIVMSTNGTERMRIAADGNVGIGTLNPTVKLDVVGQVAISTGTYPSLSVETTSTQTNLQASSAVFSTVTSGNMADGFGSGIQFAIEDDANLKNSIGFIGAVRAGSDNSGRLNFFTNNAGTSTEKMTILPSGNVGIGTETPTAKLDVVGDLKHTGLTMTTGTNVDQTKSTTLTSALTTAWTDVTGVSGTYLSTGSYIVQIISNGEYYTGNMAWFSGTTTTTVSDEITLHRAGPAASAARIYARVTRTSSSPSTLKLQVSASASVTSHTLTFNFRRTI